MKTTRERDKVAEKIVNEIINHLEEKSDLGNVWDEMDDDDQKELKNVWLNIVKRYLPIDKK